jgi:cell division protein FtsB
MNQDAPLFEETMAEVPSRPRRRVQFRPQETRQRSRRLITWALFAAAFVLMVNSLVGENGYLATLRARRDYDTLHASITRLQQENDAYRDQIQRLQQDPAALEETARRELGLALPGESVIILRDTPAPSQTPK